MRNYHIHGFIHHLKWFDMLYICSCLIFWHCLTCNMKQNYIIHQQKLTMIRASQSVVFNSDQKIALRAVYVVICQSFCQISYDVKRFQRHLLAGIENDRLGGPIFKQVAKRRSKSYYLIKKNSYFLPQACSFQNKLFIFRR